MSRITTKQGRHLIVLDTLKQVLAGVGVWNDIFSKVGRGRYFASELFPWVLHTEAHWQEIRKELDQVLEYRSALPSMQDISPDQIELSNDPRWKSYPLYMMGQKAEQNSKECPNTAALLSQIPGIKNAFFSILEPGKHIAAHTGPYNGILRWHLALKVPQERHKCGFKVGGELRRWEEGKSLVFDDTHLHEAWNHSEEQRVVLLIDFVRPIQPAAAWFNTFVMKCIQQTEFAKDLTANQKKWEELMRQKAQKQASSDKAPNQTPQKPLNQLS